MRLAFLMLSVALVEGCRPSETLQPVKGRLRFERVSAAPSALSVSSYADGQTRRLELRLVNESRAAVEPTFSGLQTPFGATFPGRAEPGLTPIVLDVTATAPGTFRATLTATAPGYEPASVVLEARFLPIPACRPSAPCREARFDTAAGRCVEVVSGDGTACDPKSLCVSGATCRAGRCVGEPVVCDDGNACTIDVCQPEVGCEALPAPPCPSDGECRVGVCDPRTGCTTRPAADGTLCGGAPTCGRAELCIAGACVVRDPPDGFVCEEASPCRDEGRCEADACVHGAPARTLSASWTLDTALDGGPSEAAPYHDFVVEPQGQLSLSSFFASPVLLRANEAAVMAPAGAARRCVLWNQRLVCADYPSSPNGKISAIDPSTGASAWTFDVRVARPDFLLTTSTIFLARLVVQGPDRLAALYEAYPLRPASDNGNCRMYFLVVLDAGGGLVMARPIEDPLLAQCVHPHPYGVAADAVGNLYVAFSPTMNQSAPLVPDQPTMLVSYTHDGLFRWKTVDASMRGGELAVARGLLYAENSAVVRRAANGEAAFALPAELGRAVVSSSRLIPAPAHGADELSGYEAGEPSPRWVHRLPAGTRFWGEQLRLARMATSRGPRTVALGFVESSGRPALEAIDAHSGAALFRCEVELPARTPPQLMELFSGGLAVMAGALTPAGEPACGKCDPPFAGSRGAFWTFPLPGLGPAGDPWVGTFGGPGHAHQEQ